MLARAGSFYYKNLSADGMLTARKLTQLHTHCRVFSQFASIGELLLSGGYFNDFGIIRFSEADVVYYGAKSALQVRPESEELTLKNYTALQDNGTSKLLAEQDSSARLEEVLAFPVIPTSAGEVIEMPVTSRDELTYGLYIDPNTFVSTITTDEGKLLLNGVDFMSFFGLILFRKNPITLFPEQKFLASSMTVRKRNILSYVLGVSDVYGPVDKIMEYCKVAQTPRTFYLAAAQAMGMCVVPESCIVLRVEPLHKGCAYITDKGKLYAPYAHVILQTGTKLSKNTVIGGKELFDVVFYDEALPGDLGSVSLDYLLPVKGLYASNTTGGSASLADLFEGSDTAKNKYIAFLKESNGGSLPSAGIGSTNIINYVRNNMAPRRCMILRINEGRLYRDMQMNLEHFIERELPIGVVLLKENMVRDF
jgi:hypothetical protein